MECIDFIQKNIYIIVLIMLKETTNLNYSFFAFAAFSEDIDTVTI